MKYYWYVALMVSLIGFTACQEPKTIHATQSLVHDNFNFTSDSWQHFVAQSQASTAVQQRLLNKPREFLSLAQQMIKADGALLYLVDKQHILDASYAPDDLIALDTLSWVHVNRKGHTLRAESVKALKLMHEAALQDGITLLVSSTYRSYQRQQEVYAGWVAQLGQQQADRLSARAGTSQHQLGTTIDFGTINASFNGTPMQRWLAANAYRFGFSLSYPEGFEQQTGYDYESWHYRYIGEAATAMQKLFFDDLQYQLLVFWQLNVNTLKELYLID